MFTPPQPKYYAYQEELRNNPLIEHSINLITLVEILLIVVMIPTEGIFTSQWNRRAGENTPRRVLETGEWGGKMALRMECERVWVNAWMTVKRGGREEWLSVGSSRTRADTYKQTLKSTLWREIGHTQGSGVGPVDKTFIFTPPLVRVLFHIAPCKNILTPRGANKIAIKQLPGSFFSKKGGLAFVESQICEPWLPPPPHRPYV